MEQTVKYENLVIAIKELLQANRQKVYVTINQTVTLTYWQIGEYIVEYEQKGEDRAKYGLSLLDNLSKDLETHFGKGFSVRNLRLFRQFYQTFPIWQSLIAETSEPIQQSVNAKADAMDYVFGYTVINDISARDCRREGQWIVSKGQDTFAPMGPILVTKDEIENPHNLNLSLKVNGVEKQNSNTKFLLFNIHDLIEDLSTVFTLEAGDIIATGTPAGVGAGRNPQEWLHEGDVVEATVEGIGTIVNTVRE